MVDCNKQDTKGRTINPFDVYGSETKRVNIPVPSLKEEMESPLFKSTEAEHNFLIGRDRIIEKLKLWLKKNDTKGSSYLVTGYRGMGKTSFVDRVLYELTGESYLLKRLCGWFNYISAILFTISLVIGKPLQWGWIILYWVIYSLFLWKLNKEFIWIRAFFLLALLLALPYLLIFVFFIINSVFCCSLNIKENIVNFYDGILIILTSVVTIALYHYWYGILDWFRKKDFHKSLSLYGRKNWKKKINIKDKEWDRINRLKYNTVHADRSFSNIVLKINLGQEILNERDVLCVLTSLLHEKYRSYTYSPIENPKRWLTYGVVLVLVNWFLYNTCFLNENHIVLKMFLYSIAVIGLLNIYQSFILLRLKILHKRLDAVMKQEREFVNAYESTSAKSNIRFSYPIANIRDIETQLISIIESISWSFLSDKKLIFVFDELDKIESNKNKSTDNNLEFTNEKYISEGSSRKRLNAVMQLLGNMKYFTSTAKAKFVFIAGRELFDGYLADLTDRESTMSSLFDGVIYVESFCKNEKNERDVMYNAETFIARQLIPAKFINERIKERYIECMQNNQTYYNIDIDLKLYYEYLISVYAEKFKKQGQVKEFEESRACIDKVITLLYHFSAYLYHVSSGSPKKMRMTFEKYIRPLRSEEEFMSFDASPLGEEDINIHIDENCKYLLSFGDKEQRVIGFIHYISFPINQIITNADSFGDKLLISASFFISHIYKHHGGGFSWRNIEQTPELLEVYKVPEFRKFIDLIMNYLLQTHIMDIQCGLYQFKFRKKIADEISLASRVSEEISALFNFTLDESQNTKKHYNALLTMYAKNSKDDNIKYSSILADVHHILGDLNMQDEDYNNAIFEYQASIQLLNGSSDVEKSTPSYLLSVITNMLKLGVAYEKRRTYEMAYSVYCELVDSLIGFRYIQEQEMGIDYHVEQVKNNDWPAYEAHIYYNPEEAKNKKIEPEVKGENDKTNLEFKTKGSRMISDLSYLMTPEKYKLIQRLSVIEDTRAIYQALLAKLFILEKIQLGGITRTNLDVIEGEFRFLHLATNIKEKFMISADFYRRLGDIMYYKNGPVGLYLQTNREKDLLIFSKKETAIDSLFYYRFNVKSEIHDYCRKVKCFEHYGTILAECRKLIFRDLKNIKEANENSFVQCYPKTLQDFLNDPVVRQKIKAIPLDKAERCSGHRVKRWSQNLSTPCYACSYYHNSLSILINNLFGIEAITFNSDDRITKLINCVISKGNSKSLRKNHLVQLAEILDCIGQTMLSCGMKRYPEGGSTRVSMEISSSFLSDFLNGVKLSNRNETNILEYRLISKDRHYSSTERSLVYFWLASICFRNGCESKKAAGSLKKIIKVILQYLRVVDANAKNLFYEKEREEKQNGDTKECKDKNEAATVGVLSKIVIGEYLDSFKKELILPYLKDIYSHYNFINTVEIQRIKWIFSVNMYEDISLNRLSLFPDVEEIMLDYYEMLRLCVVHDLYVSEGLRQSFKKEIEKSEELDLFYGHKRIILKKEGKSTSEEAKKKRTLEEVILKKEGDRISGEIQLWDYIDYRNEDYQLRLANIYNNISLSGLRHESTRYEHILSLKFKVSMNQFVLESFFKNLRLDMSARKIPALIYDIAEDDCRKNGLSEEQDFIVEHFFKTACIGNEKDNVRLKLLEFLIKDSIYCLTAILESVSPQHTSTTLFTDSFMAEVYERLFRWDGLFDSLFRYYKNCDLQEKDLSNKFEEDIEEYEKYITKKYSCGLIDNCEKFYSKNKFFNDSELKTCPFREMHQCKLNEGLMARDITLYKEELDKNKEKNKEVNIDSILKNRLREHRKAWNCSNVSDRFFSEVLYAIAKPNVQYTLATYSLELAKKYYQKAKDMHTEGKSYKEEVTNMYYLDDDLKNDTVMFDLAVERFKVNNGAIDTAMKPLGLTNNVLYDIESFSVEVQTHSELSGRFSAKSLNVYSDISNSIE